MTEGKQDWHALRDEVKGWLEKAGNMLKESLKRTLSIDYKSGPDDLVTEMDKRIELFLTEKIHENYPGHHIISEEGYGDDLDDLKGTVWLVDPIDGTMNFVHQQRHFAISVGVYENGKGRAGLIYDVMSGDLYHAVAGDGAYINDTRLPELGEVDFNTSILSINTTWVNDNRRIDPELIKPLARRCRGTRSYGSAAIELAYVAAGTLDGYLTMRLSPWDYGAGKILVEEVGGTVSRVDGDEIGLLGQHSLFAGPKNIHKKVTQHISEGVKNGAYINQGPLK